MAVIKGISIPVAEYEDLKNTIAQLKESQRVLVEAARAVVDETQPDPSKAMDVLAAALPPIPDKE